jgi:hypothetical protein
MIAEATTIKVAPTAGIRPALPDAIGAATTLVIAKSAKTTKMT